MSSPCIITRILEGSAEKLYYLIKFIKSELEKTGLNPKIYLVISDQERVNLFLNPGSIPQTLSTESELKGQEKSTIGWGFTFPSLWGKSEKDDSEKSSNFTYLTPISSVLSPKDDQIKEIPMADPNDETLPYKNFRKNLDMIVKYKGGGIIRQNYRENKIEIRIEI